MTITINTQSAFICNLQINDNLQVLYSSLLVTLINVHNVVVVYIIHTVFMTNEHKKPVIYTVQANSRMYKLMKTFQLPLNIFQNICQSIFFVWIWFTSNKHVWPKIELVYPIFIQWATLKNVQSFFNCNVYKMHNHVMYQNANSSIINSVSQIEIQ